MGFQPEDIDDLNNLVLPTIVKQGKWTDLSLNVQHLTVAKRFLANLKKDPVSSGPTQKWTLQTANTGSASWTDLFAQDQTARANIATLASQQWALATGNYTWDTREEIFQSDSRQVICDHLKMLAHSSRTNALLLFENAMWSAPTSSSQRPRRMSGIPFWLQKSATTGFNGGNPTGFTDGAGNVAVATVPNWRNWTGTYSEVSDDSLFAQMRLACLKTNFEAPDPYPQATPQKPNWMFYTDSTTRLLVERDLLTKNDNIKDSGEFIGLGMFNSIKFDWVPVMEDSTSVAYDTQNPVYGINWSTFDFEFQMGSELKFGKPHQAMNCGHNVRQVDWDASCNLKCMDRRSNFVFYKA